MIARKLNQAGLSPLHSAPQNDRTQAVLRLLKFDKGLVRVTWRDGLTPLHQVVQTGKVDLLFKFLEVCPEAIEDVTVRDEMVFHLTVKTSISRHETAKRWEKELLSWPDIDGNMFWTLQLSETHLR
uniref:Uncharacterized protein n=1 Tax=Gossypium raimondii TaxID=29730 RepID=A0A0D2RSS3_GOSRA|nr:hypothetical protein B456_011G252000 [Gossypium raimondii]